MFFSMSMLLLAAAVIPADLPTFQRDVSPAILAARPCDAKHWRQIEPAVHHLALQHADRLAALDDDARTATLAKFAGFIDGVRKKAAGRPVLASGRTVIGLLDPATGLGPKEVTTIAEAYGGTTQVFKKDEDGETLDSVADAFLAAVPRRDGRPDANHCRRARPWPADRDPELPHSGSSAWPTP